MSLVNYSDSDDDDGDQMKYLMNHSSQRPGSVAGHKRKWSEDDLNKKQQASVSTRPPPLPSAFATLYASNVRASTSDDPAFHGGRRRQVPHTSGLWPSFVFLEWLPCDRDVKALDELILKVAEQEDLVQGSRSPYEVIQSSLRSDLGVRLPLHVSLSAPLTLTADNKDIFKENLVSAIPQKRLTSFETCFSAIRWVGNTDGTRYFLVLSLNKPSKNELQTLLTACNQVAADLQLPQLYAKQDPGVSVPQPGLATVHAVGAKDVLVVDDMFHISIAWRLTQPRNKQDIITILPDQVKLIQLTFDSVLLKIGNQVSALPLTGHHSSIEAD